MVAGSCPDILKDASYKGDFLNQRFHNTGTLTLNTK